MYRTTGSSRRHAMQCSNRLVDTEPECIESTDVLECSGISAEGNAVDGIEG